MPRNTTRSFLSGLVLTAMSGATGLLLFYLFFVPTSDLRTRIYILIDLSGWGFTIPAYAIFVLIGSCVAWLAGWHNRWSTLGVLLGGVIPLALVYLRLMGYTVWMHDEDVTTTGRIVRILLAIALLVLAYRALRAGARHQAAA